MIPQNKKALLDNLELDLLKLDNKVRFILGVVRGEIIVNNWKREDLFLELQQKGFTPFPKKSKGIDAAIAGAMVEEDGNEESPEVVKDGAKAADYEYLLSMAIGNLTWEKVQELCADRKKLEDEVKELKKSTPKDLWMKDLDALEKELDEQDRKDAEDGMKRETRTKSTTTAAVSRQGPKKPRKNNANNSSTASDVTSADAGNAPEAFKPEPRGHTKKAPAKKVTVVESDEDEEVLSLKDRLASYNLDSSPYQSAMETGAVLSQEEQRKKEPSRRKASRKASSTFTDISDGDDADDDMPTILEDDEQDFELVEAPKGRKQRGKKPANEKAKGGKVGTTATRKRRSTQGKPAPSQKLITEVQKPVENVGISPEKKVRKTSASPLNKKSGSVLGRIGSSPTGSEESGSSSTRIPAELNEVPVAAARPKRENRTRAVYIESDSETDEPAIDGSDFDLEED